MATDDRLLLVSLEANTKKMEGQLKRLTKLAVGSANGIDNSFKRANDSVVRGLGRSSRRLSAATNGQRQLRGQIQNTAFQFQDLAVQINGGTAASVALGQQLPQLLGGFGALGAVIGAVVAVGVPLAATLIRSGENAQQLDQRLKELKQAADAYTAAARAAVVPTAELREKYGEATQAAREFIIALRDVAKVNAFDAVLETLDILTSKISGIDFGFLASIDPAKGLKGELREIVALLSDPELSREDRIRFQSSADEINLLRSALIDLQLQLNELTDAGLVTEDQTLAVASALAAVGEATGPADQAAAASDLLAVLESALGPYEDLTEEGKALFEQLANAGEAAAAVAGAGADAQGTISAAAEAAARLAKNLGISISAASRLSALERQGKFPGNLDGSTGTTSTPNAPDGNLPFFELPPNPTPSRSSGGGGARGRARRSGGGGGSRRAPRDIFETSDRQLRDLQRDLEALGKTGKEVVRLTTKYELLDAAKKENLDLDQRSIQTGQTLRERIEAQADAVADLSEQYKAAKANAEFFDDVNQSLKDGLLDAIIEGENLGDVLEDLAKKFARAALEASLFGSGPFGGGSSGGLLGSVFSGLFGGFKASGGPVYGGKGYVVGENGPEFFQPRSSGTIIPNGASMGGGAATVAVEVYVNDDGTLGAIASQAGASAGAQVSARVMQKAGPRMVRDVIGSGAADKGMALRYGQRALSRG